MAARSSLPPRSILRRAASSSRQSHSRRTSPAASACSIASATASSASAMLPSRQRALASSRSSSPRSEPGSPIARARSSKFAAAGMSPRACARLPAPARSRAARFTQMRHPPRRARPCSDMPARRGNRRARPPRRPRRSNLRIARAELRAPSSRGIAAYAGLIANERVPEPKCIVSRLVSAARPQQLPPHEGKQRRPELLLFRPAVRALTMIRRPRELPSGDRGAFRSTERSASSNWSKPCREQGLDRRRDGHAGPFLHQRASRPSARRRAGCPRPPIRHALGSSGVSGHSASSASRRASSLDRVQRLQHEGRLQASGVVRRAAPAGRGTSSTIGASLAQAATYSSRSRNVGRPLMRVLATQASSGCSRASVSSVRRTALYRFVRRRVAVLEPVLRRALRLPLPATAARTAFVTTR